MTNVKCGGDGTLLITDQGAMLACGNNTKNKLGLSEGGGLFSLKLKVSERERFYPEMSMTSCLASVGCSLYVCVQLQKFAVHADETR